MVDKKNLLITPKTRIGELIETYPELEPVLMNLAPAFKKLKNPVLRKTIGKVATLQQAASLGGVPVAEIVNTLRAEVGQETSDKIENQEDIIYEKPGWFNEKQVRVRFDATSLINSGASPMQEVLTHLEKTGKNEIFLLITPFLPAPIIELITKKGYTHYCRKINENEFHTFFIIPL
ncbi:MAG: DUF1858 domain-containing protein [Bacteroidales bacterium]|nr:DUF1858 domain-containing protein [Bacteroidales bacterium]